jgi:AcrR family transcriptional regulator
MCPRAYRMDRRQESADETRQRIVRATYELHAEKGVAATTVREIAERADVAIGTVYNHFATYDDIIVACGNYSAAVGQPPDEHIFDGVTGAGERLHALVDATYSFYRRVPGFERARADRDRFAPLEQFYRAEEDHRRQLLLKAVAPLKPGRRRLAAAFATLDVAFYRALMVAGLSHGGAVDEAAALLAQWLSAPVSPVSRKPSPRRRADAIIL